MSYMPPEFAQEPIEITQRGFESSSSDPCGTRIQKEPGPGSSTPVKNNSFSVVFTQNTVLRLLMTDQIMGKVAQTMSEAWSLWDRFWADTRVIVLSRAGLGTSSSRDC